MVDLSVALKNAPKGLELYSPWFGDVTFEGMDGDSIAFTCKTKTYRFDRQGKLEGVYVYDDECGYVVTLPNNGECTLFPHRNKTDWNDWQAWLMPMCVGKVIANRYGYLHLVGKEFMHPTDPGIPGDAVRVVKFNFESSRFATPEETKEYFSALESNGFEWNKDEKRMCRKKRNAEPRKVPIDQIMAGDSLLLHGKKVEVVIVDALNDLVGCVGDGIVGYKYVNVRDLEQIPISEGMVLRNGYHKLNSQNDFFVDEYETDDKHLRLVDVSETHGEGVWYLHIDDDDMDSVANMMVDSFHDLQHAYRRYNIKRGIVY